VGSAVKSTLLSVFLTVMPLAVLVATQITAPATAAEQTPSDAAVRFVIGFSDDHFAGLLGNVGGRSEIMAALFERHGEPVTDAFNAAIGKAVTKHRAAWQHNLALVWTPLLTEDELVSLTLTGADSPHLEKYLSLRAIAGEDMRQLSAALFDEALAEVIEQTVANFAGTE
jgi:hypothetical protein